jgi:surface antigen
MLGKISGKTDRSMTFLGAFISLIFGAVVFFLSINAFADSAQFVSDVTYPDHSVVNQGSPFTKTWRFRNTGANVWEGYRLYFKSGNHFSGPSYVNIPTASTGNEVDISVNLQSPSSRTCAAKDKSGTWEIRNNAGNYVPGGTATVTITVNPPSGPNLDSASYKSPYNRLAAAGYGGQCTAFAWGRANEVTGITTLPIGNAKDWWTSTTLDKGSVPQANSIAVWGGDTSNAHGHVAYVEAVNGSNITINEANYSCYSSDDWGGGYDSDAPKSLTTTQMSSRSGAGDLLGYIYLESTSPQDKTLVQADGYPDVYWLQNNKRYHVLSQDVISGMTGMQGWGSVNVFPGTSLNQYPLGPEFIEPSSQSSGLLIRYNNDRVYVIENGEKRWIICEAEFNQRGYDSNDVIEVTQPILDSIPSGVTLGYGDIPADFNCDGRVNAIDLAVLMHYFGSTSASIADINQDGRVDGYDLMILAIDWYNPLPLDSNLLYSEAIQPTTLEGKTTRSVDSQDGPILQQTQAQQEHQSQMWLSPNKGSYEVGNNFNVDILVNTGGEYVVVGAAYIKYNPKQFQANSIDTTGSIFTIEPEKIIDSSNGMVGITRGVITPGVNTTNGKVAAVNFTALSPVSPKANNLTIVFIPSSTVGSAVCRDDGFGTNMLSGVYGARFSVRVPLLEVAIDIKRSDSNRVNLRSHGEIAVAILSNPYFDAPSQVDRNSLTFGATGDEKSLVSCKPKAKDFDHDGLKDDLVCQFYTKYTGFQCGDTKGILKGKTKDGTPIEGKDSVKIVPCK